MKSLPNIRCKATVGASAPEPKMLDHIGSFLVDVFKSKNMWQLSPQQSVSTRRGLFKSFKWCLRPRAEKEKMKNSMRKTTGVPTSGIGKDGAKLQALLLVGCKFHFRRMPPAYKLNHSYLMWFPKARHLRAPLLKQLNQCPKRNIRYPPQSHTSIWACLRDGNRAIQVKGYHELKKDK